MMDALNQALKVAHSTTQWHISVICDQTKALYLSNPKLIQRLPRTERAYWYWFVKNTPRAA